MTQERSPPPPAAAAAASKAIEIVVQKSKKSKLFNLIPTNLVDWLCYSRLPIDCRLT